MIGYEWCTDYWWLLPLSMFVLCFVFLRGRCNCICGFSHREDPQQNTHEEQVNHDE
jgi:hypothetical protein